MFSQIWTHKSTGISSALIPQLLQALDQSDAVVIGAGAGLSSSAGLTYSGERFLRYFKDFQDRYGIRDMYTGGFYPYETQEEYWAWWSRHILLNRYQCAPKPVYTELLELVRNRNYFILTTNVDHQFQLAGFDPDRLFQTQGDYGLWQCATPCHAQTYANERAVRQMVAEQTNMRIPTALIPHCPVCGGPMTMNLRCDDTFVQDDGWDQAHSRYETFLSQYEGKRVLYLELGVGDNTPAIIKYPFWKYTFQNPNARYVSINLQKTPVPHIIADRTLCIHGDIGAVIARMV
jgi:hypothetical protein